MFLIVERDGAPIGRVYLHESSNELRLMEIALLPEARGHGLGTALLRAVLDHAREAGVRVTLHVEPDNPAQHLYTRLGFRLVEHRGVYDVLEWAPSRPLAELTADDFEGVLRAPFTLRPESGDTIALVLNLVARRPTARPGGREGFALVFESASGVPTCHSTRTASRSLPQAEDTARNGWDCQRGADRDPGRSPGSDRLRT